MPSLKEIPRSVNLGIIPLSGDLIGIEQWLDAQQNSLWQEVKTTLVSWNSKGKQGRGSAMLSDILFCRASCQKTMTKHIGMSSAVWKYSTVPAVDKHFS